MARVLSAGQERLSRWVTLVTASDEGMTRTAVVVSAVAVLAVVLVVAFVMGGGGGGTGGTGGTGGY